MLVNPNTIETEAERKEVHDAAQAIGQQLITLEASSEQDIETALATFVQRGADALYVGTGAFLYLCVPNIRFSMDAENGRGKFAT